MLQAYITAVNGVALQAILAYDKKQIEIETNIELIREKFEDAINRVYSRLDVDPTNSLEEEGTDATRWVRYRPNESERDFRLFCNNVASTLIWSSPLKS